ncbi:putative zinc-type alcohol dehydrogenase-like protein [Methylohalomonas lacus]|uniref:Zinc-type alcohol dehydrogenase-like protein n=1 Tax=Methylohalomonas lacus TaxID=398773 RepID=A0AAE3L282_9GAMM|nr:NAD(P)-dependent alcohol dehydrogenase [Methylohalomonas lacus]MCS3904091.1 putative zinc-type alcohol dehydrogenase-like protein [Methylohalomonas lacus]
MLEKTENLQKTAAYGTHSADKPLEPLTIERRQPGPRDVQIDIDYCGVCHTDIHFVRNEWGGTAYPIVPGHEIIGRVTAVGDEVTGFEPGQRVGVGCLVDSCRTCPDCKEGLEQYCQNGFTLTYNSPDPHTGKMTYGGYSSQVVVDQDFVLRVSEKLDAAAAAPLLCAGITTYSPLNFWNIGPGQKVGVVGLGGLGHMAVKIAHAMGAEVVLFTTSPGKTEDAKRLGASEVVVSKNDDEMQQHAGSLDFILNTVAAPHNLDAYLSLLKRDGTMCLVGVPGEPHPAPDITNLVFGRRKLAGSLIGGLKETQEMLDFCAEHGITSDVEVINIEDINDAYERMLKSDVKYRFVIDIDGSLKQ